MMYAMKGPPAVDDDIFNSETDGPGVVFGPNFARQPASEEQQGAIAEAIKTAETALAQQNSLIAQRDLHTITAILNAHTTHEKGRVALDELQDEIETAVVTRSDLDTPSGARSFQHYLLSKLRDIRAVVDTADLDATSQAAMAAALASLYTAQSANTSDTAESEPQESEHNSADSVSVQRSADGSKSDDAIFSEMLADPMFDELLAPMSGLLPADQAGQDHSLAAPVVPGVPAMGEMGMPNLGGLPHALSGGLPGSEFSPLAPLPRESGYWQPEQSDLMDQLLSGLPSEVPSGQGLPKGVFDDLAHNDDGADTSEPESAEQQLTPDTEKLAHDRSGEDQSDEDQSDKDSNATVVQLPSGETIIAPSVELAAVITAAVSGSPVAEAFQQQGIIIPAPGSEVVHPVDPHHLRPGDIGIFTDRHALALGQDKALFNNQIQPVDSVTGAGFLGWEHPTEIPQAGSLLPPAATRPAVTPESALRGEQ